MGRVFIPKFHSCVGPVIECKKAGEDENPLLLCRKALEQIDNKHYAQSYEDKGYTVYKYGISFTGKSCRVATDKA